MAHAPQFAIAPHPDPEETTSSDADLWHGVDRLLDHARTASDVRVHKLELLALARWRVTGRASPQDFPLLERRTIAATLAMPGLLERIRAAVDGPLLLMKGPEVAARYPRPALRTFSDVDLLVEQPERAQQALLAAGFELVGDERLYRGIHHLRPLYLAGAPAVVELHERPKWVDGLAPPSASELLAAGVPAAGGVQGLLAPRSAHHALILAAHSWAHQPLRRIGDLVDVAAMAQGVPEEELTSLATAWSLEQVWSTTSAAIRCLFLGERPDWPLRSWARNLPAVRDRSVLESHLERWFSAFSAYPVGKAVAEAARAVAADVRPESDETWSAKARRSRTAVKNAFVGRTRHDEELRRRSTDEERGT